MPLHPQAEAVIRAVESMGLPPFETMSLEEGRGVIQAFANFMPPKEEVASVVDTVVPAEETDIPLRIYTPEGDEELRPGILYFHGGGFSTGGIDLVDPVCRALANRSGCAVISVGYRLGPEHPYPAAVTDAYIATVWVHAKGPVFGIDPDRLAVMGDSAGGNLATVTCMILRDKGEQAKIALQVLIYPVTDLVTGESASRQEFAEGYLLTAGMMQWFTDHYLKGCDEQAAAEPYCSPLFMENLTGLPPAIIVVAEYDPLRDEGIEYATRLKDAGNFVDLRREQGMIHGFFWLGGAIDRGRELIDELGQDLRQSLLEAEIY
ncbi:MAG: alpha/beta hydrolase [Actinomycetota bacterium]|jgi:acetyl esterase